jgi:hypothetical protein
MESVSDDDEDHFFHDGISSNVDEVSEVKLSAWKRNYPKTVYASRVNCYEKLTCDNVTHVAYFETCDP